MKKISVSFSIFFAFIIIFTVPKVIFADGAIQLVSFQKQINQQVGSSLSVPVNFIYSGSDSDKLGVSILGTDSAGSLPMGVAISSISKGANGLDSVTISGTPTQIGNYPLNLLITDNSGALLTLPFVISISQNNFSLPDATVSKHYSQEIPFGYETYSNNSDTNIHFIAWQNNASTFGIIIDNPFTRLAYGNATLNLHVNKAGHYTIEADVQINNMTVNTETFQLNVVDPNSPAPVTPQTINQNNNSSVVAPTPVVKTIYLPTPSSGNTVEKTTQPTTTVQNTQQQATTTTMAQTNAQPIPSHNIFVSFWNFLKRLF